jgi:tetratricopeptide (TPR) repeat protein
MILRSSARTAVLAAFLFVCASAGAADQTLVNAKALLDGGNPQAAYGLLAPLQSERAGDPEFDYLLGSAALDLGKSTEAVFALERVLALQPNNGPARAQIARAYFNLKETEAAKREFENVKKQDIPPEVSATIDRYLDAIARIGETEKASARFFLEFAVGYDSNVNSATAVTQVAAPGFGGIVFTLTPASRKLDDGFMAATGGINVRNPISKRWAVVGGLTGSGRANLTRDNFDTLFLDGYLGLSSRFGRETVTAVAQINTFILDDPQYPGAFRNAAGGTVQWAHDFNARSQLNAYVQYASLEYPGQSPRDADRYIVGLGYAHAFRRGDPVVYVGVYAGDEVTKDSNFDYLGHRPLGLRVGGQKSLSQKWLLFFSGAYENRQYNGTDPSFLVTRKDNQYSAGLGVSYLMPFEWRLSPQVTYIYNDSSLEISEFHRLQAFVTLRRDW